MFIVPLIVAFMGCLLIRGMIKQIEIPENQRIGLDLNGAVLAICGISSLSFGLIFSAEFSWLALQVWLPIALGLLLLIGFIHIEKNTSFPILPIGFILNSTRAIGLVGILLAATGMGLITFLLSLYLQQYRGWSPFDTSMAFIPYVIGL